jgi:hypothetical protein
VAETTHVYLFLYQIQANPGKSWKDVSMPSTPKKPSNTASANAWSTLATVHGKLERGVREALKRLNSEGVERLRRRNERDWWISR